MPSLTGGGHTFGGGAGPGLQAALAGRLLVDTYLAARETVKEVDYSLATLSRSLLSQERSDLQASSVPGMQQRLSPSKAEKVIQSTTSRVHQTTGSAGGVTCMRRIATACSAGALAS